MSVTQLDALCVEWHEKWKNVINDPVNREYIAGKVLLFLDFDEDHFATRPGQSGTIEQLLGGDAAHYMAFAVKENGHVIVFDPAGPGSPYFDSNLEGELARKFGRKVFISPASPQRSPSDNFCQTWSLAWLCGGEFETLVKECSVHLDNNPNEFEIEFDMLNELCDMIMRNRNLIIHNFKADWSWCIRNWRVVSTNFDKFRITAPTYRADTVRRELRFARR